MPEKPSKLTPVALATNAKSPGVSAEPTRVVSSSEQMTLSMLAIRGVPSPHVVLVGKVLLAITKRM
jgi:hypothetical protein